MWWPKCHESWEVSLFYRQVRFRKSTQVHKHKTTVFIEGTVPDLKKGKKNFLKNRVDVKVDSFSFFSDVKIWNSFFTQLESVSLSCTMYHILGCSCTSVPLWYQVVRFRKRHNVQAAGSVLALTTLRGSKCFCSCSPRHAVSASLYEMFGIRPASSVP